jgi:hypothetical protein
LDTTAGFELLLEHVWRVSHSTHDIIMRRVTVDDTPMKGFGRFLGGIIIYQVVPLDVCLLVMNGGLSPSQAAFATTNSAGIALCSPNQSATLRREL